MTIEVTGLDGSVSAFPDGTPTSTMQTALAKVYGGPQTAGSALAQLSDPGPPQLSPASDGGRSALSGSPTLQGQSDPIARANLALAPLPPGGGYGPVADATKAAASPWLNALASDPSPVWSQRLGLLGHARALREAASAMAGSMLDNGDSPVMAGLALDPDSGEWTLPKRLDGVTAGPAPTAATWLGLYHTLPSLMQTDPWTGQVLSDADSPRNANIASIAGQLSDAFIGDPLTGAGGAIPGYGPIQNVFGDPFTIRAAHAMDGTLFSSDPDAFTSAWAKASTPAEQAAARSAVASEIADRIQNGQVLPGQLGAPDAQGRLATAFGLGAARNIAAQAESLLASRYRPAGDEDQASPAPAVTAPPNGAVAMDAQPFMPMTPIAASLIQGFDPGGVASSLVPPVGGRNLPARPGLANPALAPLRGPLLAPPQGQFASGDRYSEGGDGAPVLDAAGNPEIVVTARRRYPVNAPAPIPSDLGSGHSPGLASDLWRGLDQFANPDSGGFYAGLLHSAPLTPAQLAPVRRDQAAQLAADQAYSVSPPGLVLGAPVAASAFLLGATAADVAPLLVHGAQAIGNAALRFAINHPRAVAAGALGTKLAYGGLTGTNPDGEAPIVGKTLPDPPRVRIVAVPRNIRFAGQTYPLEMLPPELQIKYPRSVKFTPEGFPDFSPYAQVEVRVGNLTGNNTRDAILANKAAGLAATPEGFSWHHVENGETMQLVPTELHKAVGPTGGASIIKYRSSR
jgi:hypothetical protein